jgi:alkylglycerol monooxygenase
MRLPFRVTFSSRAQIAVPLGLNVVPYTWIHDRFASQQWTFASSSPAGWACMFVVVDFVYYWFHRLSHEVNLLWAAHSVHHSSNFYNLTTALRQSAFQGMFHWVFYLPFAPFFPPVMLVFHKQWNALFQFWLHTEVVPKLGWLEYLIVTPSQHRVHHGRNPYCIDTKCVRACALWALAWHRADCSDRAATVAPCACGIDCLARLRRSA